MHVCPECGLRYDAPGFCGDDGRPLVATDDPLLGSEVGRFRLTAVLGEGGMGRVYVGVQPHIGSRVAIKVLSFECVRVPDIVERFFKEARAINLISHESIVKVLDLAWLPDGRPYIVMEYVAGKTLSAAARQGNAPLGGIVVVMTEVLSALDAAHAIGIVHRDLKPDNILVTEEGHAKVLDFGIAKLAPELHHPGASPRTQTGALLGTPQYMSPEQIEGSSNVDARSDVYAAGVVLYQAVTGHVPFEKATLFELMRAHIEDAPPPPRAYRADLPPALEQVILRALAKRPEDRFATAGEMASAVRAAAAQLPADQWRALSTRGSRAEITAGAVSTTARNQLGAQTTVAASPVARARGWKRRAVAVALAIAALMFMAGVAFELLTRDGDTGGTVATSDPPAAAPVKTPVAPVDAGLVVIGPGPVTVGSGGPVVAGAPPVVVDAGAPAGPTHGRHHRDAGAASTEPMDPYAGNPPVDAGVVAAAPADAGASRGGVHVEGNVKFEQDPPPAADDVRTAQADYNAAHFDPLAYLPKATALAKALIPDAQLTSFEFDPVDRNGVVDLGSPTGRDHEYEFRSPSRSQRPANLPGNAPFEAACLVHVEIGVGGAVARVRRSTRNCAERLVRSPHCSLAWVRGLARARGVPDDYSLRIGWLFDEKWFIDADPYSTAPAGTASVNSSPDSCR
jgi:hypothetical protein